MILKGIPPVTPRSIASAAMSKSGLKGAACAQVMCRAQCASMWQQSRQKSVRDQSSRGDKPVTPARALVKLEDPP